MAKHELTRVDIILNKFQLYLGTFKIYIKFSLMRIFKRFHIIANVATSENQSSFSILPIPACG